MMLVNNSQGISGLSDKLEFSFARSCLLYNQVCLQRKSLILSNFLHSIPFSDITTISTSLYLLLEITLTPKVL